MCTARARPAGRSRCPRAHVSGRRAPGGVQEAPAARSELADGPRAASGLRLGTRTSSASSSSRSACARSDVRDRSRAAGVWRGCSCDERSVRVEPLAVVDVEQPSDRAQESALRPGPRRRGSAGRRLDGVRSSFCSRRRRLPVRDRSPRDISQVKRHRGIAVRRIFARQSEGIA